VRVDATAVNFNMVMECTEPHAVVVDNGVATTWKVIEAR
jgi:hypothetical protein